MTIASSMYGSLPGTKSLLQTTEGTLWWGSQYMVLFANNKLIDSTAVDAGSTPTTFLRPGLILAKKTSDSMLYAWNHDATDGTELIYGVLLDGINMLDREGTAEDKMARVMVAGPVIASSLLIEGTAFTSSTKEQAARRQMAPRFRFDDDLTDNLTAQVIAKHLVSKTGDYTVVEADNGKLFDTTGAAGAVIFTLPAIQAGLCFEFLNTVDQNMTVQRAGSDTMIAKNNASAVSVAFSSASNKIGARVQVSSNPAATKWLVNEMSTCTITVS